MTARSASDLIHGRAAARHYRDCALRLEGEARRQQFIGNPPAVDASRQRAVIARRAATAEEA